METSNRSTEADAGQPVALTPAAADLYRRLRTKPRPDVELANAIIDGLRAVNAAAGVMKAAHDDTAVHQDGEGFDLLAAVDDLYRVDLVLGATLDAAALLWFAARSEAQIEEAWTRLVLACGRLLVRAQAELIRARQAEQVRQLRGRERRRRLAVPVGASHAEVGTDGVTRWWRGPSGILANRPPGYDVLAQAFAARNAPNNEARRGLDGGPENRS